MPSLIAAQFRSEEPLLEAARRMRAIGYRDVDLHSPVPVKGAEEALGLSRSRVPLVCLAGGLTGACAGYLLQWWTVGVNWPINVGNRPPNSPLAFVPITFELGVLFASLSVFIGLLVMFGFPRLHHPVFEVEAFRTATIDALWMAVRVQDGEVEKASLELRRLGAREVSVVSEVPRAEAKVS